MAFSFLSSGSSPTASSSSLQPVEDMPAPPPRPPNCHPLACLIQTCLNRSQSDYSKCSKEILNLYECCERVYLFTGGTKEGVKGGEGCPSLAVLKGDLSRMRPGRGFGVGEDGREMDGLADVKEQATLT